MAWTFNNFSENVWKAMESVSNVIKNQIKAYCIFGGKNDFTLIYSTNVVPQ